jgi:sirohydrochlorin cobaltochelatase
MVMNTGNDKPRRNFDAANSPSTGLLVIGHGTREPAGVAEFLMTAERIAAEVAPLKSEACFLELAEPTIDAAVARLAAAGIREILVAPLILFAAGHAKRDIPEATAAAAAKHGISVIEQLPHLGCRPEVLHLSARRYRTACEMDGPGNASQTLLLMIGRGSRDPTATAEMHEFAALRQAEAPCGRLEVAFTAMAEPGFEEALEAAGRLPFRRVVVQPHLLFAGQLLDRIRAAVADSARRFPDREWIVTGHLGPEPEIVAAISSQVVSRLAAAGGVKANAAKSPSSKPPNFA